MGIFKRLAGRTGRASAESPAPLPPPPPGTVQASATLYTGDETLEVVGESNYQDVLWSAVGGWTAHSVRSAVVAVLMPEPENDYDENAIAVHVSGAGVVGYLRRSDAAMYLPGLRRQMAEHNTLVALEGVIVGGGSIDGRAGMLGIFLSHDPVDFGLANELPEGHRGQHGGTLDTGFTEAWQSDLGDDSYDLSWASHLPEADRPAIAYLRELLTTETSPISRHYMYSELEQRLYRCRDLYESALDEFDQACASHDTDMDVIREVFITKFGMIPRLATYRQMTVRLSKAHDWDGVVRWAERGLAIYGSNAAREEAVEDLQKRLNRARSQLARPPKAPKVVGMVAGASVTRRTPPVATGDPRMETLTCTQCAASFERLVQRGRKPHLCPACR